MHFFAPEDPHPKQIKYIVKKVLDGLSSEYYDKENNTVSIYFSKKEMLEYFLSDDNWVCIEDCISKKMKMRQTKSDEPDDILSGVMKQLCIEKIFKEVLYIYYNNQLLLSTTDEEESLPRIPNKNNKLLFTPEYISLCAGWWMIKLPRDFRLRLLLKGLKKTKKAYQVGEGCIIDIDNMEIIGELGGRKISKRYGDKTNKYFSYLDHLLNFRFSENENVRKNAEIQLDKCGDDIVHDLRKMFKEVTDDQIISYKDEKLDFASKNLSRII